MHHVCVRVVEEYRQCRGGGRTTTRVMVCKRLGFGSRDAQVVTSWPGSAANSYRVPLGVFSARAALGLTNKSPRAAPDDVSALRRDVVGEEDAASAVCTRRLAAAVDGT